MKETVRFESTQSEATTGGGQEALVPPSIPRNNWDPKHSDLVELVISDIVQLYKSGEFKDQIYPHMLVAKGDNFKKFYKAAFLSESAWSKERFPEGWQGFVSELNTHLSASGLAIINTKREVISNTWLPDWERTIVRPLSNQVRSGEKTTEEALGILRAEFSISLPPGSIAYYFPSQGSKGEQQQLSQRKDALSSKIQALKSEFNIDLTISSCLQGLVFEKYVGAVLRVLDPQGPLESQRFCKISYRDLSGKEHYCVYPDWISGEKSWEVKLRNSVENILESALPQSIALGQKQTVVYRYPCQEILFMLEANVRLDQELETMGLMSEFIPGNRIGDFIVYQPIETLIQELPEDHVCRETLRVLDSSLASATPQNMWEWVHALDCIAATSDQLQAKLTILNGVIREERSLSRHEISRLFGTTQTRSSESVGGGDKLLEIISRERSSAQDRILLAVYNSAFGEDKTLFTSLMVEQLEELSPPQFIDAALEVLASMEATSRSRMQKRSDASTASREYSVINAFERTESRRILDALHDADDLTLRCIERIRSSLNSGSRGTSDSAIDQVQFDSSINQELLKRGWQTASIAKEVKLLSRFVRQGIDCSEECVKSGFELITETYAAVSGHKRHHFDVELFSNGLRNQVRKTDMILSRLCTEISQNPLVIALETLAEDVRGKVSTLPTKSRAFVISYCDQVTLPEQRRQVYAIETIASLIDEQAIAYPEIQSSTFNEVQAAVLILHLIQLALDQSEDRSPDERLALVLQNATRGVFQIQSQWKKGVSRDGQVLQALQSGSLSPVITSIADCLLEIETGSGSRESYGVQRVHIPHPNFPRDSLIKWLSSLQGDLTSKALSEQERIFRLSRGTMWAASIELLWATVEGQEISGDSAAAGEGQDFSLSLKLGPNLKRYPNMVRKDPEPFENVLDRTRSMQSIAVIDLCSRHIAQARRIAHFDSGLALEFLREAAIAIPDVTSPLSVAREEILKSVSRSDQMYEALIGPYRWNGSLFK